MFSNVLIFKPAYITDEAIEHQNLLKNENIRSDFHITPTVTSKCCQVTGSNISFFSPPTIYMWPGLKEADKDAYNFLLLRQFYYLKNNAVLVDRTYPAAIAIATFALTYFTTYRFVAFGALLVSFYCSFLYIEKYFQDGADSFAIQNGTDAQLAGGIRYLKAVKEVRKLNMRNWRPGIAEETADGLANGEYLLYFKSKIIERIDKIKSELNAREKVKNPEMIKKDPLIWSDLEHKIKNVLQEKLKGTKNTRFFLS